ncbi:MAG: hypothetical protein ACRDQY_14295 [Pseudonocardiaceae bacterium]
MLGFAGNSFFNGDVSTGISLVILAVLTLCTAVNISPFRADTEAKTVAIIAELQEKLKKHLNQVHASFVRETSVTEGALANSKHVYDAGTAAVHRAQKRIFVIGDYCPPAEEDAALDKPPEHRSEYLQAIEQMLAERLDENSYPAPALKYHRFIQRPINVYKEIKGREATGRPGIVLKPDDMIGDMQVFEHCMRVLDIAARGEKQGSDRIRVQIKVIPFLPNCPSVMLVDDRDVQFTIPTRIDRPRDNFARQGLLGVLLLERQSGRI